MQERDYRHFKEFLDNLTGDIYSQPPDDSHKGWAEEALRWMVKHLQGERLTNVLDVGCGQGFCQKIFEEVIGISWVGVTIGSDYKIAEQRELSVHDVDMSFLPWQDETFDLIFARHVLEHSPFPVITLMEWRRVCAEDGWLFMVCPAPDYWGYRGRNHYSMASLPQVYWWLERAGWRVSEADVVITRDDAFKTHFDIWKRAKEKNQIKHDDLDWETQALKPYPPQPFEFWFLCRRGNPIEE